MRENPLSQGARSALLLGSVLTLAAGLAVLFEAYRDDKKKRDEQTPIFTPPVTTTT